MISVAEALKRIEEHVLDLPAETVALPAAVGRILRGALYADRDFPPFNRVAMDGIAIAFDAYRRGEDFFLVTGIQLAGAAPLTLTQPDTCLEVMTGAMLPTGTDTVIRYEDLKLVERNGITHAHILEAPKAPFQNVHRQGSDRQARDLLVPAGTRLSPAEIAVAATVGQGQVRVTQAPRMAIVSTGDELVNLDETPLAYQIRKSNAYMLQAALQQQGVTGDLFHLPDNKGAIRENLTMLLQKYDALLLSGGVSKGKADFLPEVLAELGVERVFHQVTQKPGKPLWFGRVPAGPVVFALPGNPNSTFLCFYKFVLPWLQASLGAVPDLPAQAVLQQDVTFQPNLTYFLPVKTGGYEDGRLLARPLAGGGSGDLAVLLEADGFLELPRHQTFFPAGEVFPFIRFRN